MDYPVGQKFNAIVIKTAHRRSNFSKTLVSQQTFTSTYMFMKKSVLKFPKFSILDYAQYMILDIEGHSIVYLQNIMWDGVVKNVFAKYFLMHQTKYYILC